MRLEDQEKAKLLRSQGHSVREIAKILTASKGSISSWVKNVSLTRKQLQVLNKKQGIGGSRKHSEKARERRLKWQLDGRMMAKKKNAKFIAGVMLFWAEGSKRRNTVVFSNGDAEMIKFFITFLRENFYVKDEKFSFRFQWYSGNGLSVNDVEEYWLSLLKLKKGNMRTCYIDYRPVKNIGRKKGKLPYGVGQIIVNSTEIVQKLYGAIQEIVGFTRKEFAD
jgi:hypothetical protein